MVRLTCNKMLLGVFFDHITMKIFLELQLTVSNGLSFGHERSMETFL